MQNCLGIAYANLPTGDRGENLVRAVGCFEQVLTVYTPETAPLNYAGTQHNLGNVYADLPTGDREENLACAIACYMQASRFWTPEAVPFQYAMTQNDLGNAYAQLPTGDRGENLARAIECYERALAVDHLRPREQARYLCNLAAAYQDQGEVVRAVEAYGQALALSREVGDRKIEATASWYLGLLFAESDPARAAELMQVCVDYEREIGHPDAKADAQHVRELRERAANS
jgi:tetratricopeptide (TPR) repeat protein